MTPYAAAFWPAAPIVSYLLARRLEEMASEIHLRRTASRVGATSPQAATA